MGQIYRNDVNGAAATPIFRDAYQARVQTAFLDVPLNPAEGRAVQALLDHPYTTPVELSRICGWGGTMWHTHFRTLCQRRRAYLDDVRPGDAPQPVHDLLADYDADRGSFALKPGAAAAFRSLGLHG